jgi:cell cycle arrest protein BUB2
MNVLAAPFLYAARSESEAFTAFYRLITTQITGYITTTLSGVHRGLALVDKVLAIVDPRLSNYLLSKGMNAEIYAFPSVLTLCACTPPLPEVLRLWDFLFAYGVHLNLLAIVAQLVILREEILRSPRSVPLAPQVQTTKISIIAPPPILAPSPFISIFAADERPFADKHRSPTKILRSFPPLQADMVKEVTLTLIKKIPDDVYAEIVDHAK